MSTHMLIPVIFYTITRSIPCNIVPCIIVSANRREQEYIVTQEPLCFVCVDESYTGAFCTHIPYLNDYSSPGLLHIVLPVMLTCRCFCLISTSKLTVAIYRLAMDKQIITNSVNRCVVSTLATHKLVLGFTRMCPPILIFKNAKGRDYVLSYVSSHGDQYTR